MIAKMVPQYVLMLFLPLFLLHLFRPVQCQGNGDEICVEGFVMDKFCVDLGTLLDKPDLISLEYPGEHSLHCLVDVKECYESPFLILGAPVGGSLMYTVAYQVDDSGRETLIALARASGLSGKYPACSTCTNDGEDGLLQGFRAEVVGIVTDSTSDPPTLTVSSASVSNGRAATDICVLQQSSEPPTRSPQTEPTVSNPTSIILPTARPITTKPSTSAPIAALPSSLPSVSTNSQESFFPTFEAPTTEPMDVQLTEKPSQIKSLVPSSKPTSRSNSSPVSFPNTTTNMTTNIAPTPTTTGSQNVVTNTGSTSSADSIPTNSYGYIIWLSLQNVLWLAPLLAICEC